MLNRVKANEDQIKKIISKHLRKGVYNKHCSYDSDDKIYFFSAKSKHNAWIQWRNDGGLYWGFSLQVGSTSYDVDKPKGKLLEIITKLGDKIKEDFLKGQQI